MSKVVVGIDTSSYTTSMAAVTCRGDIVCDARFSLHVPEGEIGLRQSRAVFEHINNAPRLTREVAQQLIGFEIDRVCVSDRPRPQPNSYLPVFKVGLALSGAVSIGKCDVVATTHQHGHLACVPGFLTASRCIGVHISGGTTEVLVVDRRQGESVECVARTVDLHAGQFIDRIGAKMGFAFPSGPDLDRICRRDDDVTIPSPVTDGAISFSGPHSAALRLLEAGRDSRVVAAAVLLCIARAVAKGIAIAVDKSGVTDVYIGGGVAASVMIRTWLSERLPKKIPGIKISFAPVELCTDNAVGVARVGTTLTDE